MKTTSPIETTDSQTSTQELQSLIHSGEYEQKIVAASRTAMRMIATKKPLPAVREAVTRSLRKNNLSPEISGVLCETLIASAQKKLSASDAQTIMLTGFLSGQQCLLELAESIVSPDEDVVTWLKASNRPPFLVRIIPFIPDLVTRGKDYLIVVTNERLLIARLTKPFNPMADPKIKEIIVQAPLASVASASGESGLTIHFRDGQHVRFSEVSEENAAELALCLRTAEAPASGTTPIPVIKRHRSILRMLVGSFLGLIAIMWSIGGISNVFTGEFVPGLIVTMMGVSLGWGALRLFRPRFA